MSQTSAFAFERLVVGSKPVQLSSSIYRNGNELADVAFVTCEGEVRYRYDGGDPTSEEGHLLRDGYLVLKGELQISKFRAISVTSDNATLQVSYER